MAEILDDAGRHEEADSVVALVREAAEASGAFRPATLERLRTLEQARDSVRGRR